MTELEQLRAENEKLKAQVNRPITFKVSPKGAVSAYGLGRFPVTLYQEQWGRILDKAPELRAFIAANASHLNTK